MKEWEQQQEMKEMQQMGEAGSSHIAWLVVSNSMGYFKSTSEP
jgi:hypothetical protein